MTAVVIALFAEIVQQNTASANTAFGIVLHPLQLFEIHFPLAAFIGKTSQLNNVGQRIKQNGIGRSPVSACTAYLLIKAFNAFGHIIMEYPAYITFVNAHSESNCGTDNGRPIIFELLLNLTSFSC